MHTLLIVIAVLIVLSGSTLTLFILQRLEGWASRRDIQCWVLAIPVIALFLVLGALIHFVYRECFLGSPSWDYVLAILLPIGMGVIALGSVVWGVLRLALLSWFAKHRSLKAAPELQVLVQLQAEKLGLPCPRLLVCWHPRPVALTFGIWHPTLLLSSWMLEHLDRRELEAVIAHELAHIVRRDSLVVGLATILRDAFFYLPTSRMAYRLLQQEKELACDDLAIALTRRPLSLASALAKVWHELVCEHTFGMAQSFADSNTLMQTRIERLMTTLEPVLEDSRQKSFKITGIGLMSLVVLEIVNAGVVLGLLGCGPLAILADKLRM